MKVMVDWSKCTSTGSCVQICPEVFSLDWNGQLQVRSGPDESLRADVDEAADMCPSSAISVSG